MMNHDGSQQYTFGYGLATTPQIQQLQQQQQQQIQIQQHHFHQQPPQRQHPQILQQQQSTPSGISTQNVFQLQVGGNPAAAALLQQQNDSAVAAAASPTIVQHAGLISQPVIHASISVSLDNTITKPLQVQGLNNSMEAAMVYPQSQHQSNGLKIITNSGNFMQQQQPEIHFQSLATAEALGNSGRGNGIFDGMAAGGGAVVAAQGNMGSAFGKQTLSGWVRGDVAGGGNQQQQHYNVGQSATLPSFGHLWSQFQQQKTQVNIIQQQQQQPPLQVHSFQPQPTAHLAQQSSQQFAVSAVQNINNVQMIKVQQAPTAALQDQQSILQPAAATLFQSCATPVQQNMLITASQPASVSSPLPQTSSTLSCSDPPRNKKETGRGSASLSTVPVQNDLGLIMNKKSSKSVHRKLKSSSQDVLSSSSPSTLSPNSLSGISASADNTVRIKPSNRKALSESGPPKVTVTLDSLPNANSLSQFPEKTDSLQHVTKITTADKTLKGSQKNAHNSGNKFERNQSSLIWQQHQTQLPLSSDKKKMISSATNHLTSSTGSSLDRPSSEDSNFSSPPYSFTPPGSIDSVFSPPPMKDMTHHSALNSADIFSPILPSLSSVKSTNTPSSSPPTPSSLMSSATTATIVPNGNSHSEDNHLLHSNCQSHSESRSIADGDGLLHPSSSPLSQSTMFSTSLMSASCCSIAITTTSVTSSSPRTKKGDIVIAASAHLSSPLSSPDILSGSKLHCQISDCLQSKPTVDHQRQVRVPYSWQRNLNDGVVVYLSPSGAVLSCIEEIRDYLLSHDTCKCGLECPFQLEDVFVFDPSIGSMPWCDLTGNGASDTNPMGNLCNHRREILAMAAFHQSQTLAGQVLSESENSRGRKREGRKSFGSVEDFVISPLKKLRTSITNAVNKHALLHKTSSVSRSNLPSPMSELENAWQMDDNVFFPIPAKLNNSDSKLDMLHNFEDSYPLTHTVSSDSPPRRLKEEERQKFLLNSENLVYSNHHPSQRLGSKGNNNSRHSHSNRLNCPSSNFPLHQDSGDVFLYHNQLPCHQNQKMLGMYLHNIDNDNDNNNNTNNHDPVDKDRDMYDRLNADSLDNSGILPPEGGNQLNLTGSTTAFRNAKQNHHCLGHDHHHHHHSHHDDEIICFPSLPQSPSPLPPSSTPPSLSNVSFFENPTVFVAQQTAMINSSISSCNINSPSPGFLDDSVTLVEPKESLKSSALLEDYGDCGEENHLDTSREEDEDHKINTDLESNKSFSDTTENNDSAYLSQTGSDQEKSDTIDGLDCIIKSSDVYDFNTSEEHLGKLSSIGGTIKNSLTDQKLELSKSRTSGLVISDKRLGEKQIAESEIGKERFVSKNSGTKSLKSKQSRTTASKKKGTLGPEIVKNNCLSETSQQSALSFSIDSPNPIVFPKEQKLAADNFESSSTNSMGSLNRDLSQLLASNNWNIPALQKVLAQHSAGDPEHLRQVIQQMMTQITTPNDSMQLKAKGPTNADVLNSDTVSNMAAVILNNGVKMEMKTEDKKEKLTNGTVSQNNLTVSSSIKAGKNKSGILNYLSGEKTDQIDQSNDGNNTVISTSIATSTVSTGKGKEEFVAKPSPLTAPKNNQKALMASTGISSASAVSTSSKSLMVRPPQQQQQQHCNGLQTSIILNAVKSQPAQLMSISGNTSNSATTTVIVSKPLQMTQVIPNNLTGINQPATVLSTQQFLGAPQQLLNTHHQSSQNSPQQLVNMNVNSLSLQGLNNPQLFISNNPIQQASPSSVTAAQLSPAMAAAAAAGQILAAQTQQHQQQMSPSFIPTAQLPKPCSASISSLAAVPNNASAIPIAAGGQSTGIADVSGTIPQAPTAALAGNVITGPPQNSAAVVAAAANASVYSAAANQPLFVIPQAKPVPPQPPPPPVVQLVGGSSQTLNPTANGLQGGDISVNQILNQISADQNQQLQNLINAASASGFNATTATALGGLQQQQAAWNTVNLNTQQQQQQQQQLQLLQLQQLMLPAVIGNQSQTLPNASVCCPTPTNSLMNAMVGHQGLQINQVVDVKAIQQNLAPAGAPQGFPNPGLSPVAAQTAFSNQIHQMASPLTVQVGSAPAPANQSLSTINTQVSLSKPINILQAQPAQQQQQALQVGSPSIKDPVIKKVSQTSSMGTNINLAPQSSQTIMSNNKSGESEPVTSNSNTLSQPQQLATTTVLTTKSSSLVSNGSNTNTTVLAKPSSSAAASTSKAGGSKSKSKSKKSESTKVKDPQAAKDEEHIANAVNQILAQAVQQQRELTLAAQNAPPPPPKSRNRKRDSQARARQAAAQAAAAAALQQAKEQELGKIASISDDAVFHHTLQPPRALPLHAAPQNPLLSLSNGSSPLSLSSSLSFPSSTTANPLNHQGTSPSLPLLVNNNNNNKNNDLNASLKQFAILSSSASSSSQTNIVIGSAELSAATTVSTTSLAQGAPISPSLSQSKMGHLTSQLLPAGWSSSCPTSSRFSSTPSSTITAVSSSSVSKINPASGGLHPPNSSQQLPPHKSFINPTLLDSEVSPKSRAGGNANNNSDSQSLFKNGTGNNNGKNLTMPSSPSLIPNMPLSANENNNSNSFRKSPLLMNSVLNIGTVTNSKTSSPPSSSTSTSLSSSSSICSATPKKSSISLKEHLSSIVFSKDKDSLKKKSMTAKCTSISSSSNSNSNNEGAVIRTQAQGPLVNKSIKANCAMTKDNRPSMTSPTFAPLHFNESNKSVVKKTVVNGECSGNKKAISTSKS